MNEPDVSIAICTRDRAKSLYETLGSIGEVIVPSNWSIELLVIDNGSTDETKMVAQNFLSNKMTARYIFEGRHGVSVARNRALLEARGRAILFTDDDLRVPPDWLQCMCSHILNGERIVVAGGVTISEHLVRDWFQSYHWHAFADSNYLNQKNPKCLIGANMAFARAVLHKVPKFDEELGAGGAGIGEETLFAMQLIEAGYDISPAFDICVEHHFDESRLRRASLIADAQARGRATAYMVYHWYHIPRRRFVRLRILKHKISLTLFRLTHARENSAVEGLSEYEASLINAIAFNVQYLKETKRPHNYALRGLVKLTSPSEELAKP